MFCFTDPAFRGRGIGTALVEWDMARLREIAAEHDDAPEKLFETWLNDKNVSATDLIRRAGFEPITYAATMVRPTVDDLPDHRLPEGLEIRPVREEDMRTIWEADVEAFRDHWGFTEQTEEAYQQFISFPYNDPTLWKIAWDEEAWRPVSPTSTRLRTRSTAGSGATPRRSRPRAAGAAAASRRRSSSSRSASSRHAA